MHAIRRRLPLAALAATAALALPQAAQAATTDVSWALGQTTVTYGPPTSFHISTGGSAVDYRWLDTLTKDTVISANGCSDLGLLGSDAIGAGDTGYHRLFNGAPSQCFVLRGRVASGQGSTTTRTGRVSR
jgi:hypothetical protein